MSLNPILMKKLLKSVLYVTREQYTGALFTADLVKRCKKKKKKKEMKTENAWKHKTQPWTQIQTTP